LYILVIILHIILLQEITIALFLGNIYIYYTPEIGGRRGRDCMGYCGGVK